MALLGAAPALRVSPSAIQPVTAVLTDVINSGRVTESPQQLSSGAVSSSKQRGLARSAASPLKLVVATDAVLEHFSQLQLTPQPAATQPPGTASPLTGFSFQTPASVASNFTGFLTHPQRTPEERVLRLFADEDPDAEEPAAAEFGSPSSSFHRRMEQVINPVPGQGTLANSATAKQAPSDSSTVAVLGARTPVGTVTRQPVFAADGEEDSSDDEIDLAELVRMGVSPASISSCCRTPVTPAEVLHTLISPGEAVGTGADADLGALRSP
ncbi:hypothetical protein CHLRE_12g528650v5 [Chlamydomonas reinhardtii]|uniref:Uncharacterized protein n=1 Tax=Chlamydomonas reinhardtii TaxID=3055 RepID=A0A2K3D4M8_CHLRE|nr:uncharacterized protein CHLRE_12g528650v5 [Chlamydomonas reinhardtii]PNW75487.1 hypothetical protein CHLRE_12g528650v5 [Chlamydomonas reinhardtii]